MTDITTHKAKSVSGRKRRLGIIFIVFTALTGGAIAFAAWTTQGTGSSGTVTAGTQTALVVTGTTPAVGLTPGTSRPSTYTIENLNTYEVTVTLITANATAVTLGLGTPAPCTLANSLVTVTAGKSSDAMHVATVISRRMNKDGLEREYRSHLVRRTFREDGKVKHQTLANISTLPGRCDRSDPRQSAR